MLARPDRVLALLTAIEKKELAAADLSPAQVQQLKAHPNAKVKARASAVFKQSIDADRAKVVAAFAKSLELKGGPKAGKVIFQKHCSACHKLDGVGHEVGPNLLAVLGNKSGDDLLVSVFDPNREVDPRYRTYQVGTADERVLTGIVVAETPYEHHASAGGGRGRRAIAGQRRAVPRHHTLAHAGGAGEGTETSGRGRPVRLSENGREVNRNRFQPLPASQPLVGWGVVPWFMLEWPPLRKPVVCLLLSSSKAAKSAKLCPRPPTGGLGNAPGISSVCSKSAKSANALGGGPITRQN